jgi:hypothetical protein
MQHQFVSGGVLWEPPRFILLQWHHQCRAQFSCTASRDNWTSLQWTASQDGGIQTSSVCVLTGHGSVQVSGRDSSYRHCVHKVLVGKPEGKRPRRRWEDGIRMDLREIGFVGVDWIRLAQDKDRWRAVVSAVMNLRVLAPRSSLVSW